MSETNKSILSHVSIGTNDFDRAAAFYDKVMPAARLPAHRWNIPDAVAYGKAVPGILGPGTPIDGHPATIGNGVHISFTRRTQADAVNAFHAAALEAGAVRNEGEPGAEAALWACLITVASCATPMGTRSRRCIGMLRPVLRRRRRQGSEGGCAGGGALPGAIAETHCCLLTLVYKIRHAAFDIRTHVQHILCNRNTLSLEPELIPC